ncbi:hypothetical protein J5N97_004214 [Dioscorea zingiberensis]|uniref:Uncharacterized protein n=1 Tax=Dioscorea zingiberensis TaxID=325984 RepID=A0A9D5D680_9LILI|nr:hypothetical protein J5N97_004214 [Dioscorea zingiberensis]
MSSLGLRITGIVGNIISVELFLLPLPTMYKIYSQRDVEEFPPFPHLATLLNCAVWLLYTMTIADVNMFGVAMQFLYIVIFITYGPRQLKVICFFKSKIQPLWENMERSGATAERIFGERRWEHKVHQKRTE